MKRFLLFSYILLPVLGFSQHPFFEKADAFFKSRMVNNRINYSLLRNNRSGLDSLIRDVERINVLDLDKDERKAFYVNAYNLLVIKGVVENYPVSNIIEEMPNFFNGIKYKIAGEQLTLDQIEFMRLFGREKDPRLHFVLNCGAYSCPTLYTGAILPDQLEEQLDFSLSLVMDRDYYVFVDHETKSIFVNKIFDWYREDFVLASGSLRQFINFHRFTSVPKDYEIKFLEYDWRLNDSGGDQVK